MPRKNEAPVEGGIIKPNLIETTKVEGEKKEIVEQTPEDVVRERIEKEADGNINAVTALIREPNYAVASTIDLLTTEDDLSDAQKVGADFVRQAKVEAYKKAIDKEIERAKKVEEKRGIRVTIDQADRTGPQSSVFESEEAIEKFKQDVKNRLETQVETSWAFKEFSNAQEEYRKHLVATEEKATEIQNLVRGWRFAKIDPADRRYLGSFSALEEIDKEIEENKESAKRKLESVLLLQAELSELFDTRIYAQLYGEGRVRIEPTSASRQEDSVNLNKQRELEGKIRQSEQEIRHNAGQSRGFLGFKGRKIDGEQAVRQKHLDEEQKLLDEVNKKLSTRDSAQKGIEKLSSAGLIDYNDIMKVDGVFARKLAEDKNLTIGKLLQESRDRLEQIGRLTLTPKEKDFLAVLRPLDKKMLEKVKELESVMEKSPARSWN